MVSSPIGSIKCIFEWGIRRRNLYGFAPGFADRKGVSLPPNVVLHLKKSIYGLKQASRQWFLKFSTTLKQLGFEKIHGDHTLFICSSANHFIMVLVYVDDIIIANTDESGVSTFVTKLKTCFKMRDLGQPKYFLGLEIARSTSGIYVCQHKYVLEMLSDASLLGCKPSSIPMDPSIKLSAETGDLLSNVES